ncbi:MULTISPECIES: conjugal transfer protein MobA [unclassified Sphingobacterium]|uniref:conjugal transfer protein MobA n=1 Tax=unclassified Sphingobacterium TaxID=2609468 RepID=UPI0025F96542|nr:MULTISPECIES: conjugal transfer protein MobA [unclassified Sphingobacterium]
MNENTNKKRSKGGRRAKTDPSIHRHVFRLTEEENAKLLSLFESSGMPNKAKFIISLLFSKEMKAVKIDKGTVDFYMRLTSFHSQFRSVGVNYNQVVKLLYRHFSEKKAAAFLYKLEKQTIEMAVLCKKIVQLTEEFDTKHLKNSIRNGSENRKKQ